MRCFVLAGSLQKSWASSLGLVVLWVQVYSRLQQLLQQAQVGCPEALQELESTKRLTAVAEAELLRILSESCQAVSGQS
jgi:hypothetical protein